MGRVVRTGLLLALASACGDDGAGGPDAMSSPGQIGDPCTMTPGGACGTDPGSCADPSYNCITPLCEIGFQGGYCSKKCGADNPMSPSCPAGAKCVAFTPQNQITYRCLRTCNSNADCRPQGYLCTPVSEGGSVCLPGLGCQQPPASGLESASFQHPNLEVPSSGFGRYQAEGNIASDDRGHLAMTEIEFATGDAISIATYDGSSGQFGANPTSYRPMNADSVQVADPVVAFDRTPAGGGAPVLYAAWLEVGSSNASRVWVARSHDAGATWDPQIPVQGSDGQPGRFLDKPWITAAGGRVWASWTSDAGLRYALSSDGGATFSPPLTLALGQVGFAQLAAADSGDAYASWIAGDSQVPGSLRAWAARWDRTGGTGFRAARALAGSEQVVYDPIASAASPDGTHYYVVWSSGAKAMQTDVMAAVSEDANSGFSFHAAVVVHDHTDCGIRLHPTVAVDTRGRGHVMWLDNYYYGGVARYTSASDGSGQIWTPVEVASDAPPWPFTINRIPGLWLGDYVGIAVDAQKVWLYYNGTQLGARTHFFLTYRSLEP